MRAAHLISVGPRPAKHVRQPSFAMVVLMTSLNVGLRSEPVASVHDCACIRVLNTSKGNVTWTISHYATDPHWRAIEGRHTSQAVTPAIPPAAMSSAHVSPELSSASASSIRESWCRCRWAVGGGGGGLRDLKKRHAASYLIKGMSYCRRDAAESRVGRGAHVQKYGP